jgi:RNA 2',3'-cyclic 3'-phosphodiesterase
MRLFVAIELGQGTREALGVAVAPLRADAPELAWVPNEKLHLTMKFLGDVPDERLPAVVGMVDGVARAHRAFSMELGGLGAFPNFRLARVVWLGVEQDARLELLHHDLELAGEREAFEVEGRAFRPHVTLARMKASLDAERARRFAGVARAVDFTATVEVAEITLFESTLAPAGARYRRIHAATLGGR